MAETTKDLAPDEHDAWHRAHPPILTSAQHEALSKKLGLTREQEDEWHLQHPTPAVLTPEEHDRLMHKLGITKEQDVEWHRTHFSPPGGEHA